MNAEMDISKNQWRSTGGVFQEAVLEFASLCNDWQSFGRHYATTKFVCAWCARRTYSARKVKSAIHYIRDLLLELPFEILWLCISK